MAKVKVALLVLAMLTVLNGCMSVTAYNYGNGDILLDQNKPIDVDTTAEVPLVP